MSKPITIKDTSEWIAMVLGGNEQPAVAAQSSPETATERFLRDALGQDAPRVDPATRLKAVLVLLEEEKRRRIETRTASTEGLQ